MATKGARRPDTLGTTVLALELLRRIPRGRKVTAGDLRRQLQAVGVVRSARTIQRQLAVLSNHFPIECDDREKPYGYRWMDSAQALAVPGITPQESLLLLLAEEHLRVLMPAPVLKAMAGFFDQARRNLGPDRDARLEREWPRKVRVVATSQPLLPSKIAPEVLVTVSDALYRNHWLRLDYKNASGWRATADVMPLGLVQQGVRLYLVCRYRGYDNERNLALNRILSAEASVASFERPKDFNLQRYDEDGRFGFGNGERVVLTFRITREAGLHLLESRLSRDQKALDLGDGTLRFTATVVDSDMLDWWLRGFGSAVTEVDKRPAE